MKKLRYAKDAIALLIVDGQYSYYAADADVWCLDYWKGVQYVDEAEERANEIRAGIIFADQENLSDFLNFLQPHRLAIEELRKMLFLASLGKRHVGEFAQYLPWIIIDYDQSKLTHGFYEPRAFEEYVPDGWEGEWISCDAVLEAVPPHLRYWQTGDFDLVEYVESLRERNQEQGTSQRT